MLLPFQGVWGKTGVSGKTKSIDFHPFKNNLCMNNSLFSKIFLKKKKKYLVVSGKKRNFAA